MRRLLVAGGCAAVIALVVAAPALGDVVTITVHGTSFTGTIKNTGTKAHNFISIGTRAGARNPVESFRIQTGKSIQPYSKYGSYFGNVTIKPGETVSFSGTTKKPTTKFNVPWSNDGGMDNTDQYVTASSGSKPPPSKPNPPPSGGNAGGTNPSSSGGTNWSWIYILVALLFAAGVGVWLYVQFGPKPEPPPTDTVPATGDSNPDPWESDKDPVPGTGDSAMPTGPVDDGDSHDPDDPDSEDYEPGESTPPPDMQIQFDEPTPPSTDTVPSTGDSAGPEPEVVP